MSDNIIVDGDEVLFSPPFPPAVVSPLPGEIKASKGPGENGAAKKPICVVGDEEDVKVDDCPYIAPPYIIPGTGSLTIKALGADQKAKKTKAGGKPVILAGNIFEAEFEVTLPAQKVLETGGTMPGPKKKYSGGSGMFLKSNMTVKGS